MRSFPLLLIRAWPYNKYARTGPPDAGEYTGGPSCVNTNNDPDQVIANCYRNNSVYARGLDSNDGSAASR